MVGVLIEAIKGKTLNAVSYISPKETVADLKLYDTFRKSVKSDKGSTILRSNIGVYRFKHHVITALQRQVINYCFLLCERKGATSATSIGKRFNIQCQNQVEYS